MPYVNAGPYTIWYVEGGMGIPVVFLHDVGATNWVWKHVYPTNPKGTFYYMLDLPGHGGSSPIHETTIPEYARAVAAFAKYHEFENVFLVGHHLGGAVALELARTNPDLVRGLILINSPRRFSFPSSITENLESNPEGAIREFVSLTVSGEPFEEVKTDLELLMKHKGTEVFVSDIKACLNYTLLSRGGWRGPALHILSDHEKLFDRSLAFKEFELVVLHGAPHYSMLNAPEKLTQTINSFLTKHIKPPKEQVAKGHH